LDAQKKTLGARERDEVARLLFQDLAQTLPVERLVVVDESGTRLDMATAYARAPRGERAYDVTLENYGPNVSLIAGLRATGMTAPWVVEGAVNTAVYETYVQHILAPTLQPGDIVVMDNLRCHKSEAVRQSIEARGAYLLFLPSYSPDFSPIEYAFSKLKAGLRRLRALTFEALLDAIAQALQSITSSDAIAWFIACGFFNVH
jgi:transposase